MHVERVGWFFEEDEADSYLVGAKEEGMESDDKEQLPQQTREPSSKDTVTSISSTYRTKHAVQAEAPEQEFKVKAPIRARALALQKHAFDELSRHLK